MKQKCNTLSKYGGPTYTFLLFMCSLMTGVFLIFYNYDNKSTFPNQSKSFYQITSKKELYDNNYVLFMKKIFYLLEMKKHGLVVPNKILEQVRQDFYKKHELSAKTLYDFLKDKSIDNSLFKQYLQLEGAEQYFKQYNFKSIVDSFVDFLQNNITNEKLTAVSGKLYILKPIQAEFPKYNHPKPKLNSQLLEFEHRSGVVTKLNKHIIDRDLSTLMPDQKRQAMQEDIVQKQQQTQLYHWFVKQNIIQNTDRNVVVGINDNNQLYMIKNDQTIILNLTMPEDLRQIAMRSFIVYKGNIAHKQQAIELMFLKHKEYSVHVDNIDYIKTNDKYAKEIAQHQANYKQTIYQAVVYCDQLNKGLINIDQVPVIDVRNYKGNCANYQKYQLAQNTDFVSIIQVDKFHYKDDKFSLADISKSIVASHINDIISHWSSSV